MGKKWGKQKLGNRGSALILVLVCVLFVGILATTVLVSSATNRDMKLVNEKAKDNFYETESGIDLFIANLEERAEEMLGKEYSYMLTHYSEYGSRREGLVKQNVREELAKWLTGTALKDGDPPAAMLGSAARELFDGLDGFGTDFKLNGWDGTAAVVPAVYVELTKGALYLKGLSVSYQENGYETQITTDVRVDVAFSELSIEKQVTTAGKYEGYSIIADGTILNELTNSSVRGNVYAGKHLTAKDTTLSLMADKLIVGGTLGTKNYGKLDIQNDTAGQNIAIWGGSIETVKGIDRGQSIRIKNASCFVEDDMVLGADFSEVTISGAASEYYGYHSQQNGTSAAESSAIVINAGGTKLDLSQINKLWLAGNSFITVPSLYGASGSSISYTEVLEGETISYRGNQLAYLVPGNCIRGYGHNPLTKQEYNNITSGAATEADKKKKVYALINSGANLAAGSSMTLAPYVDSTTPCIIVPVLFMEEPEPLYYLYLNFRSAAAAQDYFLAYSSDEGFRKEMDLYSAILDLGDVYLPTASAGNPKPIETNGTIMRVSDHRITEVVAGTIDNSAARQKQSELQKKFRGLKASLDEEDVSAGGGSLVRKLVRMDEIEKLSGTKYFYYDSSFRPCESDKAVYQVIFANSDLDIRAKDISGIIIANGNVDLSGAVFRGMLLATGDVTLNHMEITAKAADNGAFVQELLSKNPEINRYFQNYPWTDLNPSEETTAVRDISITMENWFKN